MRSCSKYAIAILTLALGCTPALAQQGPPNPPPGAPQGAWAGPGPRGPADPPQRGRQMRVFIERGQGRGFAAWGSGLDTGGNVGIPGLGNAFGMRGRNLDAQLARAQRLLREPAVRQLFDISDQQADKIENQVTEFRKTLIEDRANIEVQRIDLENLLAAEQPDRAVIDKKMQQVGAAQLELEKAAVDFALNLKQELTPAQREKIRQFIRERRQSGRGRSRRGMMGRRGARNPNPAPNPQGQQGGSSTQPDQ